jgi:hypothetical protein
MRGQFAAACVAILAVSTTYTQFIFAEDVGPSTQPAGASTQPTIPPQSTFLPPVVIRPWQNTQRESAFMPRAHMAMFGVGVEGFTTFSGDKSTLLLPSLTAGYFFTKSVSLNFDAGINDVDYDYGSNGFDGSQTTVHDVGGLLTLRKIFWHDDSVVLSADVGVGAVHADGGFPTRFEQDQIVRTVGIVTDIRLGPADFLTLGVRYARVANDFLDREPSRGSNGLNYYVGLKILF